MSDAPVWARQPDEPPLWFLRFERYRLMWPHSIPAVYRQIWREERRKEREQCAGKDGAEKSGKEREIDLTLELELPKEAPSKWYELARKWQWKERAAAYDAHLTAELEAEIESEKARVLVEGFAQRHRRIATLNAKAEQLLAMTEDPAKIWLADVKSIGTGPTAERVDLVTFNAQLFHELRATLADIAAELGERVKKKELAITDLPANVYGFDPDQDGVDLDTPADQEEDAGDDAEDEA